VLRDLEAGWSRSAGHKKKINGGYYMKKLTEGRKYNADFPIDSLINEGKATVVNVINEPFNQIDAMQIEVGKFYATDHENDDGVIETNILYVLNVRENSEIEVNQPFYVTETMFLLDGQFDSIFRNDWLGIYFEREATLEEVNLFHLHRKLNPALKHWSEHVFGGWLT